MLLTLLRQRFGELPEPIVGRVRAGDAASLELWTRHVLTASTLDEVFAG